MRFHQLSFIALLIPFAGAGVALGEVASTSNRADLVAESIGINDAGSIIAVVANRGTAVTTPFVVEVELDGHTRRTLTFTDGRQTRGAGLPAGGTALGAKPGAGRNLMLPFQQNEKRTLRVTELNAGICSGSHTLKLRVDAGAVIKEADENNNQIARTLEAPCADLIPVTDGGKINKFQSRWEWRHAFWAKNTGTATSPPSRIRLKFYYMNVTVWKLHADLVLDVPRLEPGQESRALVTKLRYRKKYLWDVPTGDAFKQNKRNGYKWEFWVDSTNVVSESNEQNNGLNREGEYPQHDALETGPSGSFH